jgi:hypothetical protein
MSFYEKIKEQIKNLTSEYAYQNEGTAFGHLAIKECFSKIIDFSYDGSDFDSYIKNHIVDRANDLGNDFIFVNKPEKQINFFQFKYSQSSLLTTSDIIKNKEFIEWLFKIGNHDLKPNKILQGIIDNEILDIITDSSVENGDYSIVLYYIDNSFDRKIQTDIKGLFSNFRDKNINLIIKFYDYSDLENLYDDIEIPRNKIELEIIENEFFEKSYLYFQENGTETDLQTIITSIKASSLKRIIEEYKEMLFTLNVRYFKGVNDINSKIKDEYSKGSRSNFWILNNGINAICQDYQKNDKTLNMTNFQIVNGGQTTKTLTRVVNDIPDNVHILMRLTKISNITETSKISKQIAITSNSQNAITSRDLHSGDRIQETIFRKLEAVGIFYDKKDGEWSSIENKQKYRNPNGIRNSYLKISNNDIAKAYMSFYLQIPISTKGRDKLVFSEVYYDKIFNDSVNEEEQFRRLLFSYRISEIANYIKHQKEQNFEILQNNYINDIIVSLLALYYVKDNLNSIITHDDLINIIKNINLEGRLDISNKFQLNNVDDLEEFAIKLINGLQYRLDILKTSKVMNGGLWLSKDTNNWLKKDNTYKEILPEIIAFLKRQ